MNKPIDVVVTGIGVIAPNGIGLEPFWQSILERRSGVGPITLFDASDLKSRIGGEVKDFDPHTFIERELKPHRMARHTQFAYTTAMMALRDANLELDNGDLPSPTPVIVGVSTSAMDIIEGLIDNFERRGTKGMSPGAVGALTPQAVANVIADRLGARAHAATVSSACASGLDAITLASSMIRNGEADIAICGGTDAPFTRHTIPAFIAAGLCSYRNDDPQGASRPFDALRDSGVISEGAGMFVLENAVHAEARGAKPYLSIKGYSRQRDRTQSEPASGFVDSMTLALANASRTPDDVDYICAYGPGHPILDAAEVQFIREVFGEKANEIPVTSIKGVTGNPLAAGGPMQLAASAMSFRDQVIPPIANLENPDPKCDLNFVVGRPRKARLKCILVNVRGLGGSASSLVVESCKS